MEGPSIDNLIAATAVFVLEIYFLLSTFVCSGLGLIHERVDLGFDDSGSEWYREVLQYDSQPN